MLREKTIRICKIFINQHILLNIIFIYIQFYSLWLSSLQGGGLLCSGVCYHDSVRLVPHKPSRCTVLLNLSVKDICTDGFISLIWHNTSSHDFLWWNFRGQSCDGGQSKISFLCVLNLGGQSIVFSLLFWSLSSTTWTMLFLLPLSQFVCDCPSSNYLALMLSLIIPWFGMGECSVVL